MSKSSYRLKITPKAGDDLDQIYSYIFKVLHFKEAAGKLLARIETSILRLKDFPFSGSFAADKFLKKKGYRKLIIDNYIAFYLVDEKEKQVVVMRVLYGRQKYQNLL